MRAGSAEDKSSSQKDVFFFGFIYEAKRARKLTLVVPDKIRFFASLRTANDERSLNVSTGTGLELPREYEIIKRWGL